MGSVNPEMRTSVVSRSSEHEFAPKQVPHLLRPKKSKKVATRKEWRCENTDASLVTIMTFQALTTIYFVVNSELFLSRNLAASTYPDDNENSNNDWGFGQVSVDR